MSTKQSSSKKKPAKEESHRKNNESTSNDEEKQFHALTMKDLSIIDSPATEKTYTETELTRILAAALALNRGFNSQPPTVKHEPTAQLVTDHQPSKVIQSTPSSSAHKVELFNLPIPHSIADLDKYTVEESFNIWSQGVHQSLGMQGLQHFVSDEPNVAWEEAMAVKYKKEG